MSSDSLDSHGSILEHFLPSQLCRYQLAGSHRSPHTTLSPDQLHRIAVEIKADIDPDSAIEALSDEVVLNGETVWGNDRGSCGA